MAESHATGLEVVQAAELDLGTALEGWGPSAILDFSAFHEPVYHDISAPAGGDAPSAPSSPPQTPVPTPPTSHVDAEAAPPHLSSDDDDEDAEAEREEEVEAEAEEAQGSTFSAQEAASTSPTDASPDSIMTSDPTRRADAAAPKSAAGMSSRSGPEMDGAASASEGQQEARPASHRRTPLNWSPP